MHQALWHSFKAGASGIRCSIMAVCRCSRGQGHKSHHLSALQNGSWAGQDLCIKLDAHHSPASSRGSHVMVHSLQQPVSCSMLLYRLESRWRGGQGMCTRLRAPMTPSLTNGCMRLLEQWHRLQATGHARMSMTGPSTRQVKPCDTSVWICATYQSVLL